MYMIVPFDVDGKMFFAFHSHSSHYTASRKVERSWEMNYSETTTGKVKSEILLFLVWGYFHLPHQLPHYKVSVKADVC